MAASFQGRGKGPFGDGPVGEALLLENVQTLTIDNTTFLLILRRKEFCIGGSKGPFDLK
jgi:hypothetical protein